MKGQRLERMLCAAWPSAGGCVAMVAICHDVCSPVLPAWGEIVKEGFSPLTLNHFFC